MDNVTDKVSRLLLRGLLALGLLASATPLALADPLPPTEWTFEQALEQLKQNNNELAAAEKKVQAAQATVRSANGNYLPTLTANIDYQKVNVENLETTSANAGLTAKENLFNGGLDRAKISDAEAQLASAQANLRTVQARLSYELKVAFASYRYAEASIDLAKSILERRKQNLSMVELRFQSGRENKGSVMLYKAYRELADLDILKARHAQAAARLVVGRLLGVNPDIVIHVKGNVPVPTVDERVLNGETETVPNLVSLAEETPEFQDLKAQIQSAEAQVATASAGFLPSLDVSGSLGKTDRDFFPQNNRWSLGATLTWSLFNGGKDYFNRQSALAKKMLVELSLRNARLNLVSQLRDAYSTWIEAASHARLSSSFVAAENVRVEIMRSKYNNGLTSFEEWDRIENELITYQKDELSRHKDRLVAAAAWEKIQGKGALP